jgi:hypothetical protein
MRPLRGLIVAVLLGLGLVAVPSTAQAAPAPSIKVTNISRGVIGETDFGAATVTFTITFKCQHTSDDVFLQIETAVTQGPGSGHVGPNGDAAFGFGSTRCTGSAQHAKVVNISDPFYEDIAFEPGTATARATVYGCPSEETEFCNGFINEKTTTIRLVK